MDLMWISPTYLRNSLTMMFIVTSGEEYSNAYKTILIAVEKLASPLVKPKIPRKIIISGIIGVSLGMIVGLTYSPFIGSIIAGVVFFILGLIVKRK
jgi:hypothetical protein